MFRDIKSIAAYVCYLIMLVVTSVALIKLQKSLFTLSDSEEMALTLCTLLVVSYVFTTIARKCGLFRSQQAGADNEKNG